MVEYTLLCAENIIIVSLFHIYSNHIRELFLVKSGLKFHEVSIRTTSWTIQITALQRQPLTRKKSTIMQHQYIGIIIMYNERVQQSRPSETPRYQPEKNVHTFFFFLGTYKYVSQKYLELILALSNLLKENRPLRFLTLIIR